MIYLASPYTGTKEEMQQRYETVLHVTATFIASKHWVYSPIVHCHEMAVRYSLPHDHEFWQEYDKNTIERVESVYVLQLPGWTASRGVLHEINLAEALRKPLFFVEIIGTKIVLFDGNGEPVREFALIS